MNRQSYIPPIKNVDIYPSNSRLFIPPIIYKGNPKGSYGQFDSMYYIVDGELFLTIEGRNFVVRPGQLVHLPINKFRAHEPVSDKLTLYEIVFMAKIEGQNLFDYLHLNDGNYVVNISDHEKIMQLFEECAETMTETDFSAYIIRASNISRIISIYVEKRMNKIKDDSPFDALTNYMSNNLKGNVSLEVLSDIVYMQPTYMIKCFKRYFGTSPITYYNKMRADKAADLILNTNMTNEQIGKEIGIEDKYYFSNFFKHHFGVAPSDYRKYLKNIRNMISHYNTMEKPR